VPVLVNGQLLIPVLGIRVLGRTGIQLNPAGSPYRKGIGDNIPVVDDYRYPAGLMRKGSGAVFPDVFQQAGQILSLFLI